MSQTEGGGGGGVVVYPQEFYPCRLIQLVVAALTAVQWSLMLLVLLRPAFVTRFLPDSVNTLTERHQMALLIGAFFGGNIIKSLCWSSGAFEIFVGRQLAFSGLRSGRMPNFEELVEVIRIAKQAA